MIFADRVLEEEWKKVDDGVAATDLLEKLRACPKHHSAEVLRLASREESAERGITTFMAGGTNTVHDDVCFKLRFFIVNAQTT